MSCSSGCACGGRLVTVGQHLTSGSSDSPKSTEQNPKVAKAQQLIGRYLAGSMISGFVQMGLRLGFYDTLVKTNRGDGVTSKELALATGKSERWLREWLASQAAAGVLEWTDAPDGEMRYSVAPEMCEILLDDKSPNYQGGFVAMSESVLAALPAAEKSFTTGLGHTYDAIGEIGNGGLSRHHVPVFIHTLIPHVLPKLGHCGSVVEALKRGCRVADVGCGAAAPTMVLAGSFPASTFDGFELSEVAITLARANSGGVPNFTMHDVRINSLEAEAAARGKYDFVLTYDVLHDMADPEALCREVKKALAPDGTWLVVDIRNFGSVAENIRNLRLDAAVKYSISMAVCMSSALSEPGGRGLGTLGLTVDICEKMMREAGFTRIRPFLVEGSANQFFEISH